jgi:hypothetical protein
MAKRVSVSFGCIYKLRVYYETRALRQTRLAKLPSADGEAVTD